jgi:hypothetical protein
MRFTVLYPEGRQSLADQLSVRLSRIRGIDPAWISTAPDDFSDNRTESAEGEDPIVLILDGSSLASNRLVPRVLWAPLLSRIESGQAGSIALILLGNFALPPLLRKAKLAESPFSPRTLDAWVIDWLRLETREPPIGKGLDAGLPEELKANLLRQLVDESSVTHWSCPCIETQLRAGQDAGRLAWPYFENVQLLHAPHQIEVLRHAELAKIAPAGRCLWIVTGHQGEAPPLPSGASMLLIGDSEGIRFNPDNVATTPTDLIAKAGSLIPQIPNVEGQRLPFSTFELENLLPELCLRHWPLAERLARKAGAFFRLNHRVEEAIWVFELLLENARLQGSQACAQHCESELFWLRAGGARKQQFLTAGQSRFEF